jgi:probable F420-dependent oxidoreductase
MLDQLIEHPGRALAKRLGRVGVWTLEGDKMPSAEERLFAREIESLGFRTLWIAETVVSKDVFAHLALLLGWTDRLILASGIANIHAHDPYAMANGGRTLAEAFPGRIVQGMGVSHAPSVARRGGTYEKPFETMRQYLDVMDASSWPQPEPPEPAPRVLAALGPKMLQLAAERAAGAHPYFVPVEHTPGARTALGPGPLLAPEQMVVLETDPVEARRVARIHMRRYLRLPNYVNNLKRHGYTDADIDGGSGATEGEPTDRLVDAIVAWGDEAAIAARVRAHLAAGADHVCIQPLPEGRLTQIEQLRALAPVVLAL